MPWPHGHGREALGNEIWREVRHKGGYCYFGWAVYAPSTWYMNLRGQCLWTLNWQTAILSALVISRVVGGHIHIRTCLGDLAVPTTPDSMAGSFMHVQMFVYGLSCCLFGHDIDTALLSLLLLMSITATKSNTTMHDR